MNKWHGDPAFPIPSGPFHGEYPGMTLRDYFAAKAMQALIDKGFGDKSSAREAYKYADAMLAERDKQ